MTMDADIAGEKLAAILKERAEKELPLGLHFNLPFPQYLADKGLGSSQIKDLAKDPLTYWAKSWMNPLRPKDTDTEARIFGRAMHTRILDGLEAFTRQYVCGPDQDDMSTAEKTASTKAARSLAKAAGKTSLKQPDYLRIMQSAAVIAKNPELAVAFSDGHAEVSFFWMHDGIRCKMRMDYLKTKRLICGIGDLKSVANEMEMEFEAACDKAIRDWDYHIQAKHYLNGAKLFSAAIEEGLVHWHGTAIPDKPFIERLAQCKTAAWQWVFHRSTLYPDTFSMYLHLQSEYLVKGQRAVDIAFQNYKEFHAKWGTNMWFKIRPVREAEIERQPPWWVDGL